MQRDRAQRGLREPEVEEAGTGHLDAVDAVDLAQPRGQQLGDLAGRPAGGLGQLQGDAGRVVAVLLHARTLDGHLGGHRRRQLTGVDRGLDGGPHGGAELEGSHLTRLSPGPA